MEEVDQYFIELKKRNLILQVSLIVFASFFCGPIHFAIVSGYSISAVGDIPCNDPGEKILDQISNEDIDLHIWLGDYGYEDPEESVRCFIDLLVKNNLDLKPDTSILTLGNHEVNYERTWIPFSGHGKSYFSKNITNELRLINIDSNTILFDSDQKKWLQSELQEAMDSDTFTLVTLHANIVGKGSVDSRGIKKFEFLHPLFEKYGVDLVLSGHNHAYYRVFNYDNVNYITVGTGGASKNKLNCCFNSTDQDPRIEEYGYLILNLEENGVNGRFLSEGKTLDRFAIRMDSND